MRWDNLRLDNQGVDNQGMNTELAADQDTAGGDTLFPPAHRDVAVPLIERGAVARTFDTPGFRGMTFFEVQAKSVVNRVPESSRMSFRWTINPYRGCQHACRYCLSGDTPILMADGRTRPLAVLRADDQIYGTTRRGIRRRYAVTTVLAHWSTVKPAYRVVLDDGTQFVTSGDHRFLTQHGWKHVAGGGSGQPRRPSLTPRDALAGVGGFAEPPKDTTAYRRGYLCGVIRGAGTIWHDASPACDSGGDRAHLFRLAGPDPEAVTRTAGYLADLGICCPRPPSPRSRPAASG